VVKAPHSTVTVGIYRSDQAAEHNSPAAWKAHTLRAQVFDEAIKHKSLRVVTTGDVYDKDNTHEFAEAVVEILKQPTTQVALTAVGLYIFRHLAKPLDDWVEAGVKRLYKSLFGAFQKKQISEFFLQLPNGEQITVGPEAYVTISVTGGKVTKVQLTGAGRKAKIKQPRRRRR
jgi:hypothetical protein